MDVEISFDLSRIDFQQTSDLVKGTYWGAARTDAMNARAFVNSLCAAAYMDGKQVAFGRVVTDYCVFANLTDVIVWPGFRGHGIGQRLIRAILDHPELANVEHWSLATLDAQELFARFGFKTASDDRAMRRAKAGLSIQDASATPIT